MYLLLRLVAVVSLFSLGGCTAGMSEEERSFFYSGWTIPSAGRDEVKAQKDALGETPQDREKTSASPLGNR